MLLLTSTSDLLQVVTSAAVTIDVHASWIDNATGTVTPGRTNTAISTATTTTVVGSPGASTQRAVKALTVRNRSVSSCDITLKHTDGTTAVELEKVTLATGEQLHYIEGVGFFTIAANTGSRKDGFDISSSPVRLPVGTTANAPLTFQSGTNVTSPLAGQMEYDGKLHYSTHVDGARGVNNAEQWLALSATFTLTSQTAAQKMFNTPTNGALTVAGATAYQFECQFDLSAMSATSGSFGFALGGTATLTSVKWWSSGFKAALATAGAPQATMNVTASNATIVTATTNTVGYAHIFGIVRVNAAGTLIPQVSLGVAAAAVVGVNSFFRAWPVGTNVQTSQGNWS